MKDYGSSRHIGHFTLKPLACACHLGTLMHCCEAWEPVGKCFDPNSFECTDFHGLSQTIASLTRERLAQREADIGNFLLDTDGKKITPWRSEDLVFALGAPRSQCSVSTQLLMKTVTLLKTKMNRAGGYANIGVRFFRRALKARGTIAKSLSCDASKRLLTTYVEKLTEMNLMIFWPQKKNLLRTLMGFRVACTGALEAWVLIFSTMRFD